MNARIEKERKEDEGRLKVGMEQELRNAERGGRANKRMETENWGRRRSDFERYEVVEESEGCDDDIEIIGGNVPQASNKNIGGNIPEAVNKNSYVRNWLRIGEEEQNNRVSDEEQLDENVEDLDKASTPDDTAEDSFEKTEAETKVSGEVGKEGDWSNSVDQASKRKRGPSKASRAAIDESGDNASKPAKKSRKYCCGECEGFKRANCDTCPSCLDKPKNGGPNKLRQKCSTRACSAQ